jgi:uncharacterized membrane protein (UPF0127 family)
MRIRIGKKEIQVEVAAGWKKYLGYMFRKEPSFEEGMLFVFDTPQKVKLWSPFVGFPLDVIFLNKRLKIKEIAFLEAWDLNGVECQKAKYALELKSGFCKKFKIKKGTRIKFSPFTIPSSSSNPKQLHSRLL